MNGRTFDRLEKLNDGAYKRWANMEWWQEGYERLWTRATTLTKGGEIDREKEPRASSESVVYLTADSDEELLELKEDETYVIGGIVDHNRYTVRPPFSSSIVCQRCNICIALRCTEVVFGESHRVEDTHRSPSYWSISSNDY